LGFEEGWWLVDAGPHAPHYDAGESAVLPFFRWAGVRRLESLVLTHDDADHVGGVRAVLRGLRVDRVLAAPAFPGVPGPLRRFAAASVQRGARLRALPPVRVLWPPGPESMPGKGPAIDRDNAAGLVLEVGEERRRMLLLADVDSTIEAVLDVEPGVELLKVAHHGSASSSGTLFLRRVSPREALISSGRRNPFGHPAPAVLARLTAVGARIHRTDESGALWFEAGGNDVRLLDWRNGEPLQAPAWRPAPPPALPAQ
jgi:competence protein ComEC